MFVLFSRVIEGAVTGNHRASALRFELLVLLGSTESRRINLLPDDVSVKAGDHHAGVFFRLDTPYRSHNSLSGTASMRSSASGSRSRPV